MSNDLKTLKDLNQEAKERCIESESDKSHMQEESLNRPWSPDVIAYKIKYVFIRCPELSIKLIKVVYTQTIGSDAFHWCNFHSY